MYPRKTFAPRILASIRFGLLPGLLLLVTGGISERGAGGLHAEGPAAPQPVRVKYTSFEGEKVERYAWLGRHVVFQTVRKDLDAAAMARLCDTFDKVYEFYHDATQREPVKLRQYEGRVTISEIEKTCGAGCGYLGATGIELMPACFQDLYQGVVKHGEIDQALPYEFGRNFWFYAPQLARHDGPYASSVITGYAVFMRFMAVEAAGAKLGPFRNRSGKEFRSEVERLVDLYVADPKLNLENTLQRGAAPANAMGLGGTDLFASFCFRLCRDNGGAKYVGRLWQAVGKRPAAKTAQEEIDNIVVAASVAAGKDLAPLFSQTWRWPVSAAAKAETAALAKPAAKAEPRLVPWPQSLTMQEGAMALGQHSRIVAASDDLAPLTKILAEEIQATTGLQLATAAGQPKPGDVLLAIDPSLQDEAYTLEVKDYAVVKGGDYPSLASGSVTLLQALKAADGGLGLPHMTVADKPACRYRGAMIDLARKYHSPGGVKQVVELCRQYKIRYLHVHLSDDQLFMFPSAKFPQAGKGNWEFARFEPGSKPKIKPYTRDELVELERFSQARGVHIVPEIDMPGHAGRLVGDVREAFGFPGSGSTLNIASPKTLEAAATLWNEVMDVFQGTPYVHLGGDEAGLGGLENTPEFKNLQKQFPDLKGAHDLYCKFMQDMHGVFAKRGKKMIVWEEACNPGGPFPLPKDTLIMVWCQGRNPADIAKHGYSVVNATWTPLYIVRDNRKTPEFLFNWAVPKFGREGSNDFFTLQDTERLAGAQLCSWENSEAIEIQSMRQRLAVVGEKAWNPQAGGTFAEFQARHAHTDAILDDLVHPVAIQVQGRLREGDIFEEPITVTLAAKKSHAGLSVKYTLDNSLPDEKWKVYNGPIKLEQTAHLRAGLFDAQGAQQGYLAGHWFRGQIPAKR